MGRVKTIYYFNYPPISIIPPESPIEAFPDTLRLRKAIGRVKAWSGAPKGLSKPV